MVKQQIKFQNLLFCSFFHKISFFQLKWYFCDQKFNVSKVLCLKTPFLRFSRVPEPPRKAGDLQIIHAKPKNPKCCFSTLEISYLVDMRLSWWTVLQHTIPLQFCEESLGNHLGVAKLAGNISGTDNTHFGTKLILCRGVGVQMTLIFKPMIAVVRS